MAAGARPGPGARSLRRPASEPQIPSPATETLAVRESELSWCVVAKCSFAAAGVMILVELVMSLSTTSAYVLSELNGTAYY